MRQHSPLFSVGIELQQTARSRRLECQLQLQSAAARFKRTPQQMLLSREPSLSSASAGSSAVAGKEREPIESRSHHRKKETAYLFIFLLLSFFPQIMALIRDFCKLPLSVLIFTRQRLPVLFSYHRAQIK